VSCPPEAGPITIELVNDQIASVRKKLKVQGLDEDEENELLSDLQHFRDLKNNIMSSKSSFEDTPDVDTSAPNENTPAAPNENTFAPNQISSTTNE